VRLGPGETLFGRETAAMAPAVLGGFAATAVVLAWKRLVGLPGDHRGHRQTEAGYQVRNERAGGT
jgi:hypothetical protein